MHIPDSDRPHFQLIIQTSAVNTENTHNSAWHWSAKNLKASVDIHHRCFTIMIEEGNSVFRLFLYLFAMSNGKLPKTFEIIQSIHLAKTLKSFRKSWGSLWAQLATRLPHTTCSFKFTVIKHSSIHPHANSLRPLQQLVAGSQLRLLVLWQNWVITKCS